ncbi:MAG: ABC transporter ATP-binding protein [Spirochaetota bacterium]
MSFTVKGLSKQFEELPVIQKMNLEVPDNGVTTLLGPSGCGKTTLLRTMAGLIEPDVGTIEGLDREEVTFLFQEPRLLPWETVFSNVEFVLPPAWSREERHAAVSAILADVQMSDFSAYYPAELSGGMAQRVALGRAFVYPGRVLLLDEPFQGLDFSLQLALIGVFKRLLRTHPRTSVFVTHSVREALLVGDTLVRLSERPARVVEVFVNDLSPQERRVDSEAFARRERELYRAIGGWTG